MCSEFIGGYTKKNEKVIKPKRTMTKKEANVKNELILPENYKQTYDNIVKLIEAAKRKVFETANFQTVYLFWHIGQELKDNILNGQKAEYGKSIVKNLSKELEFRYGRSYEKSSIFRMIQFYEEFPDFEKVATCSNFCSNEVF